MLYFDFACCSHLPVQSNVLVDDSRTPLLTDFGLSRVTSRTGFTASNTAGGTYAYMAPELLNVDHPHYNNGTPSQPGDVFALSIVWWEVRSLCHVHRVEAHIAFFAQILTRDRPFAGWADPRIIAEIMKGGPHLVILR